LRHEEAYASASQALIELQGAGVAEALAGQADSAEAAIRPALLIVLAERGQREALPAIRKALTDDDAKVRRAALKSVATLGTAEDFATLAELVLTKKDAGERDSVAQAMSGLAGRLPDKSALCAPVLKALSQADAPSEVCLLTVLSSLGGDQALQAVRQALAGEGEVRKTAVRALAAWTDAAPMADLLKVTREDKEPGTRILALRGYIRMANQPGTRTEQKLEAYRIALELATRPDEKRLALNGLAQVANANSLKLVEPCLEEPGLEREAFVAYERIAESLARRQPAVAKEALQRVVDKAADSRLRTRAQNALDNIK